MFNVTFMCIAVSSVLFMALFGEVAVRCFLKKKTQSASISPQENVIT